MLFIDKSNNDIKNSLEEHIIAVSKYILNKVENGFKCTMKKKCTIEKKCSRCTLVENNKTLIEKLRNYLSNKETLKKILSAQPSEMNTILNDFSKNIYNLKEYKCETVKKDINIIELFFNYSSWFSGIDTNKKYGPYAISNALNRNTCTYCNRNYSLTITKNKKASKLIRPQLDHWFSKENYPFLALSFYNLIPCCASCNSASVKGRNEFSLKTHIHPYEEDISEKFKFRHDYYENIENYKVTIETDCEKSMRTVKSFYLEEIYTAHQSEIKDLIKIREAYSDDYLKSLDIAFPNANLNKEEIYRFAFGTELKPFDFHKRPFSKFKHDILKDLNIIK
jgi:hypothetical protein